MSGPTPTPPPKNDGEYARKLALAILSTLENKGLLTRLDVDTILHAAHRAASQGAPEATAPAVQRPEPTPTVSVLHHAPTILPPRSVPAALGTQWVKLGAAAEAPAEAVAEAKATPTPELAFTPQPPGVIIIPSPDETEEVVESVTIKPRRAKKDPQPPVIDFTLD